MGGTSMGPWLEHTPPPQSGGVPASIKDELEAPRFYARHFVVPSTATEMEGRCHPADVEAARIGRQRMSLY